MRGGEDISLSRFPKEGKEETSKNVISFTNIKYFFLFFFLYLILKVPCPYSKILENSTQTKENEHFCNFTNVFFLQNPKSYNRFFF